MNRQIKIEVLVPEAPGREPRGIILVDGNIKAVYRCAIEEEAFLSSIKDPVELPIEYVTAE